MSLVSGAHVLCGRAIDRHSAKLLDPIWSETVAAGGVTSQIAPLDVSPEDRASLAFRVRAGSSGDMYVALGIAPDATKAVSSSRNTCRVHLFAGQEIDIPAEPGWKCHVVTA